MNERISKFVFKFRKENDSIVVAWVDGRKHLLESEEDLVKQYDNKPSIVIRKMYQDIAKKGIGAFEISEMKELDPKTDASVKYYRYFVGISERHPAFNLSNLLHNDMVNKFDGSLANWPNCEMIGREIVKQLYKEIIQ